MSPTNQGFIYGQPSMKQYPMQGYNIPPMNSMPPHVMGPITNQEQPTDPVQGHEAMGRVSVSGPGMVSIILNIFIYIYIYLFSIFLKNISLFFII